MNVSYLFTNVEKLFIECDGLLEFTEIIVKDPCTVIGPTLVPAFASPLASKPQHLVVF